MAGIDATGSRKLSPALLRLPVPDAFMAALTVAYVVQFSGAWYYAGADALAADTQGIQPFGTPFRYAVWLSIFSATLLYFVKLPYQPFARSLAPFLPFWFLGILSALVGIAPGPAFQALSFWILMACSATVIGLATPPRLLMKTLSYTFGVIMFLSIVFVVAMPTVGLETGTEGTLWRGAFIFKQGLGYASMWAVVITFLAWPIVGRTKALILIAMAAICLIGSGSKGSLVVAIAACGYFVLLSALVRARLTSSVGAGLLIGFVIVAILLVLYLWIPVTDALGRDPTLTGRTIIWSTYLDRVMDTPILGEGPTSFTSVSVITEALFYELSEWGAIRTPHNMYIAVFGDGGIIGLVTYVGGLFYLAFVAPFQVRSETSRACAIAAFMILVGGTVETRGVYGSSLDFFVLLTLRALAVKWSEPAAQRSTARRSMDDRPSLGLRVA